MTLRLGFVAMLLVGCHNTETPSERYQRHERERRDREERLDCDALGMAQALAMGDLIWAPAFIAACEEERDGGAP